MKYIRLVFVFSLGLLVNNQVYSQSMNEMNFKDKKEFLKSNYTLVDLSFNNNLDLDIYYSFEDDKIYIVNEDKLKIKEFNSFISFSDYLNETYDFELDFKDKYNDFQKFKTIYLRHNLCLNQPFLSRIEDSVSVYLKKFNSLFKTNITPYDEITKEDLSQLNNVMQNVFDKDYDKVANYEVPILVFVGEYFKNKYDTKWEFLNANNDFGNSFIIPYVNVNNKNLELSQKIYRYLYHPKLKYKDEKFRFSYFLDLDFIVTQSSIKTKSQQ